MTRQEQNARPWVMGRLRLEPCGMRECVLRVESIAPWECTQLTRRPGESLMQTVAKWKIGNPERWREIVNLVKGVKA